MYILYFIKPNRRRHFKNTSNSTITVWHIVGWSDKTIKFSSDIPRLDNYDHATWRRLQLFLSNTGLIMVHCTVKTSGYSRVNGLSQIGSIENSMRIQCKSALSRYRCMSLVYCRILIFLYYELNLISTR